MTGDARRYGFTPWIVRNGGIVVLVVLGMVGVIVYDLVGAGRSDVWRFAVPALAVVVAIAWTVARNLVLSATLEGGRLRARTAFAGHDVAVTAIDEVRWSVGEDRTGALNPLNQITARLRYHGRTLRVPMPAGGGLLRDLEAARSGHGAGPDERAREFDFTSWAETGWALDGTVVQHATLDDHHLRAVTVDGRDHTVALADIDDVDHSRRLDGGQVVVRHGGAELRIPMPTGAELADRLTAALSDR